MREDLDATAQPVDPAPVEGPVPFRPVQVPPLPGDPAGGFPDAPPCGIHPWRTRAVLNGIDKTAIDARAAEAGFLSASNPLYVGNYDSAFITAEWVTHAYDRLVTFRLGINPAPAAELLKEAEQVFAYAYAAAVHFSEVYANDPGRPDEVPIPPAAPDPGTLSTIADVIRKACDDSAAKLARVVDDARRFYEDTFAAAVQDDFTGTRQTTPGTGQKDVPSASDPTRPADAETVGDGSLTPAGLVRLILDGPHEHPYGDNPDDYPLSLGHWVPPGPNDFPPIPRFVARMKLTVGELKKMLDPAYPYDGPTMNT